MVNLKKMREVIHAVKTITEYLEDLGVFFMSDITDDNMAEMMLITDMGQSEVTYILKYLFEGGE